MSLVANQMNIAIIGAGLIGGKRAEAIASAKKGKLAVVADPDFERAKTLAQKYGVEAVRDWKEAISRDDIQAVIVAVPNAFAAPIVIAALQNGKHVLCEKPFGVNAEESRAMVTAAKQAGRIVKVGFNHRFHASVQKAHEIFKGGGIGKLLFIRARYGHGGRKGMEKEWRFDKKISGGGELLDQGVHIIDLARWFAGDFDAAYGLAQTKFWKTKVDDNAFALLRNKHATASFHVSTTQWKNLFSFEIFGDQGFLQIEGKGGSYGPETLVWAKKNVGAAPDVTAFTFDGGDKSWELEWKNFYAAMAGKKTMNADGVDGVRANQIVEAIYKASREEREERIDS
jgi:predicted dehydrogenase